MRHEQSDGTVIACFDYTLNAKGQRTQVQERIGSETRMILYLYDDVGRLAQSVGNGVQTQYLYDANGNLTQQQSALKTFDYQ